MEMKLEFKPFLESNLSGIMIVNPYWSEHLLNLFYQGYVSEFWEEVMDTKINHYNSIESFAYGIIGKEFSKKHLSKDIQGKLKMKYIPKEKTNRKRKFTDKEYMELYNQGMSDNQIGKIFKCSYSTVRLRRLRLHLVANYTNFAGEKNNIEQLKDRLSEIKAKSKAYHQIYYQKNKLK